MSSAVTTPTSDIWLDYSAGSNGEIEVDFVHDSSGDYKLASGGDRLRQDVLRWLLTPIGQNPFDPGFGNPLFGLLGRATGSAQPFLDMLRQAQQYFIQRQSDDAAQGWLSLDEQIDHFGPPTIKNPSPGVVTLSFLIYTKSASSVSVTAPFFIGVPS